MWALILGILTVKTVDSLAQKSVSGKAKSIAGFWDQCSHIQSDIVPEGSTEVSNLLRPWRNQCSYSTAYTAFWFPSTVLVGSSSTGHLPVDAKCCSAPVDYTLADAIIDLHNIDKGSSDITERWNVECPSHSVITAIRISENRINGYRRHLSGVKCALLINHVIDYGNCRRIDLAASAGGSRDPTKSWNAECPVNMRLLGLYDDDGFTRIKYGKCCRFKDFNIVNSLPWRCKFSGGSTCEWKNRSDLKLKWRHQAENQGLLSFLTLSGGRTLGKAQLLSPGMSPVHKEICLRLQYYLFGSVVLKIFKKSYIPTFKLTNMTLLSSIRYPQKQIMQKDFILKSDTSFQVVLEGAREGSVGVINLIQIAFVNLSACGADMCSPPAKGCSENENCRLVNGYLRCVCRGGFQKIHGQCTRVSPTDPPLTSAVPKTTSGNTGNRGGGDGGKSVDGGKEKKPGTISGKVLSNRKTRWGSWVYTAIGATAGIFLVLAFVFGFMMYRRKINDMHRRHSFQLELRRRRHLNFNPMAVADNSSAVVGADLIQLPNENVYVENPPRARIDSIWSSSGGQVEQQLDTESSVSGSPNSHHYHELEPDDEILGMRRVSQLTLIQPIYGSSEDLAESNGNMFAEPPFDEDELLSKLGREIAYHAITLKEGIGRGAFGFVKLGYWDKHNNERIKVAVKMLKEPTTMEERVKFLQEAAIMSQFDHTNVVRMYGIVTRFCSPMIVLEYMSNKNLRNYLRRLRKTRERANLLGVDYELHRLFLRMAREISAGMCYLHSLKFVHRDLAARNILLDSNLVCKIGDFGLARDLIGCEYYESGGGVIPVRWTAPEAINYKRYSSLSDTWSFGITLYEIWSLGIKPYMEWDNNTVISKVAQGYRLPPPQTCPRVVYHLMIDCWHPEETKRPRFSQIKYCLSHHDDRLIGRVPRNDRIRSVTCNDIIDNQEQGLYDDLQYLYCKTE